MSEADLEAFRRAQEAFARRDMDGVIEFYDDDIEWHPGMAALLRGPDTVYRGHGGVRDLVHDLDEAFERVELEFSEVSDLDGRLFAEGTIRTVGRGSGIETESYVAYVLDVDNGKARVVRAFLARDEALEAAGLGA